MDLLTLQAIFLFSIFCATLFPYLIPIVLFSNTNFVKRYPRFNMVLSFANCMSCGVFVGVCFLGLIPFSLQKMESALTTLHVETNFPFTETIIVFGFMLTLFIEECVKSLQEVKKPPLANYSIEDPLDESDCEKLIEGEIEAFTIQDTGSHGHSHNIKAHIHQSNIRFFILTLAMSIHSFFEGLAVGLQTDMAKATKIFIGMILHESLMAFALGISLSNLKKSFCQNLKYVMVFCIAIPAGLIIGIIIGQTPGTVTTLVNAVLQSLAAGTFIHVTFMELIPEVFHDTKHNLLKVIFIFNGFMIITVLSFVFD